MTNEAYSRAKLTVYEKADAGEIDIYERNELLAMIEAKKDEETVSKDDALDMLKQISDSFPDLEKDIKKVSDKLEDMDGGDDDSKDDDSKDDDSKDDDVEESTFDDLFDYYDSL